jgi:hypothetical protein
MARAAVAGSAEVQTKLAAFHEEEENYYLASGALQLAIERNEREEISVTYEDVEAFRTDAVRLIDEAEQAMRDELATL